MSKGVNAPQSVAFVVGSVGGLMAYTPPTDFQLLDAYATNGIAHGCINKNAQAIASSRIGLYTIQTSGKTSTKNAKTVPVTVENAKRLRNGRRFLKGATIEEVIEHPIFDLIDGQDLFVLSVYLDTLGRGYWYIDERDLDGTPLTCVPLMPQSVTPKADTSGNIVSYTYRVVVNGRETETTYDAKDVIPFRYQNVRNLALGSQSPLASVYRELLLSSRFADHMNSLLENRARPDQIVSTDAEMGIDEAKRVEEKFDKKFSGRGNGRTLFANGIKVQPLSYSPTDLAAVTINSEADKRVCNALGVPEAMMSKDANRANVDAAIYQHRKLAVADKARVITEALNKYLLPQFGIEGAFFAFDEVVPEDQEFKLKAVQALLPTGKVLVNEARAAGLLPPIAGGDDEFAQMTIGATGLGTDTSDQTPEAADDNAADVDDQPPADDGDDESKSLADQLDGLLKINDAVAKGQLSRAVAINIAERYFGADAKNLVGHPVAPKPEAKAAVCGCGCADQTKATKPKPLSPADAEKKLAGIVRRHFERQRSYYLGEIEKGFAGTVTKAAGDGLPDQFVPLDEWDEDLADDVKPLIEIVADQSGRRTLTRVGASSDVFDVAPAKIREAVAKAPLRFAQSTNETTSQQLNDALDMLREQLAAGLLEGDGIPNLTRRVNEIFDNATTERAERIAQTEASRAVHTGQQIAAKESGVVAGFKFLLSDDACEQCQAVANDTPEIPIDGTFGDGSYDDSPLPVHPYCRCTMMEILKADGGGEGADDGGDE